MEKVMRIGTLDVGHPSGRQADLYIKAEVKDGKLSISGVVGPKRNGDAQGGCGQIDMEFAHRNPADNDKRTTSPIKPDDIIFASCWTSDLWLDLLDVWDKWHLNDMQAGCEHQREKWDISKELILVKYTLDMEIAKQQNAILEQGQAVQLTDKEARILSLPYSVVKSDSVIPDKEYYKEKSRETKTAGWVYPKEHPEGLLTKPCEVCGYKYGTKWLKKELPQSVIDFISSLPDTDKTPAWV